MVENKLVRGVCGSVYFVYLICLFIWVSMNAVSVQRDFDNFDSCKACLDIAITNDKDFFFPMCADLAKNSTAYGTYYNDHEDAFKDGVVGANGDISYTACLGILAAALAFALIGGGVLLCSPDPKDALSLKLSIFGFLWTIICLMFILDLNLAEEKTFESTKCFILNITYDLKGYNGVITEWMYTYFGSMVLFVAVASTIAAMWQCHMKAFFSCAAIIAFFPGLAMLCFLVAIAAKMNRPQGWYMVILSFFTLIALGFSAVKVGRRRDEDDMEDLNLTQVSRITTIDT